MENELYPINVDLLLVEVGKTLEELGSILGMKDCNAIYKWKYPKERGGTRPGYTTLRSLIEMGATVHTLFGLGQDESGVKVGSDFEAGVREVIEKMKKEGRL